MVDISKPVNHVSANRIKQIKMKNPVLLLFYRNLLHSSRHLIQKSVHKKID
jgi:hypothetical protein